MFCHLQYSVDKDMLRKYFFANYSRAMHHQSTIGGKKVEIPYWIKLFDVSDISNPLMEDFGISDLDVWPRFSYQTKNTRLPTHIDEQRCVAININLMDHPVTIHINEEPYEYEACLIDVGSKRHSVEPANYDRLIFKLAIFDSWVTIYSRLRDKFILDCNRCDEYISTIHPDDKKFVC